LGGVEGIASNRNASITIFAPKALMLRDYNQVQITFGFRAECKFRTYSELCNYTSALCGLVRVDDLGVNEFRLDNLQQWNEFQSNYLSIDNRGVTELGFGIAAA